MDKLTGNYQAAITRISQLEGDVDKMKNVVSEANLQLSELAKTFETKPIPTSKSGLLEDRLEIAWEIAADRVEVLKKELKLAKKQAKQAKGEYKAERAANSNAADAMFM